MLGKRLLQVLAERHAWVDQIQIVWRLKLGPALDLVWALCGALLAARALTPVMGARVRSLRGGLKRGPTSRVRASSRLKILLIPFIVRCFLLHDMI